jgi:hypothetical protein
MTTTLFRPVGEKEMIKILDSGNTMFPPRLSFQPIFYPVLNRRYAIDIASTWNTEDAFGNYLGFVTKFEVDQKLLSNYEIQNVGADHHEEYWIPAEELADFNKAIPNKIIVTDIFVGAQFKHTTDPRIQSLLVHLKKGK